ncbi:sugar phosphate isomerase/epimerase [Nocardioides mangrovicus]|uniref:Sugar phosphate isomerase/epimerase n=1 Tax=Nocardioides mangrovicus TaxID=2478913 RepID=A0A3L8P5F4_9ACTN|nr:TIM barrel protein [Nocardioides mangrovicus]RLV50272.1 sugar phosphate isomerase/epimerase [Nocardioides mangrovicus]
MREYGVSRLAMREDGTRAAAERAAAAGFAHLEVTAADETDGLALPVGVRLGRPWSSWAWPAPPAGADWKRTAERLRTVEGVPRVEPWVGSVLGSTEAVLRMAEEVPALRIVLDTGHVVTWGGDPLDLVHLADHVQLREAAPGRPQLAVGDGSVDFRALLTALDGSAYDGSLSVEYVDMPRHGLPLDDPFGHCVALRDWLVAEL